MESLEGEVKGLLVWEVRGREVKVCMAAAMR
jgi:hypothetical protein